MRDPRNCSTMEPKPRRDALSEWLSTNSASSAITSMSSSARRRMPGRWTVTATQRRRVHLPQRGGADGIGLEAAERVGDPKPELLLDHLLGDAAFHWFDV